VWQNQAYRTTFDPVTFVYNKRLVPTVDVPQDHAALLRLLTSKTNAYRGKLTAFDPERSEIGYLLAHEDAGQFPQALDLFRAFGRTGIKLDTDVAGMIERVTSGERTIAYDILGSDVLTRAKKVPGLGIVLPKDYTLVVSRVALISRQARDPNAARLFLDYLLSRRGQTIMANQAGLYALRDDVAGEASAKAIGELVGDNVRRIPIDRELLANLDGDKRNEFLRQWRAATKGR
jgi:iron(III) transport system substrate-binding protein